MLLVAGLGREHLHAEAGGAAGDRLADAAEADDPERRAGDVGAEEAPGSQVCHSPLWANAAASVIRRAAAISSAKARSAVASVSASGVLPTGMPRARGRVDVDVVVADRVVGDHPQLR